MKISGSIYRTVDEDLKYDEMSNSKGMNKKVNKK